jgi:hypothetical protein
MHLNAEQLVDIAEGTRPERSAPHLADCARCREQLQELRSMMAAVQDVDVPEPSPLFWDHLSARIGEDVASDAAAPQRTAWRYMLRGALAVAAGLLLAALLTSRAMAPGPMPDASTAFVAAPPPPAPAAELFTDPVSADEDAALTLVASLTGDVDVDTAREAGLAPRGSAEHAVTHMSDGELRELRRLLKEEMARSGA